MDWILNIFNLPGRPSTVVRCETPEQAANLMDEAKKHFDASQFRCEPENENEQYWKEALRKNVQSR